MDPAQWELLDAVDQICRMYNASVTSWWRSPRRNAAQPGSVSNSQHLHGLAVDVVFEGRQPSKAELAPFLSPSMQAVDNEPGHVHFEQDPKLLLARGGFPASATSPSFPSLGDPTLSSTVSALSESEIAPTADALSLLPSSATAVPAGETVTVRLPRSPLDKLGPKGNRRG